MIIIASTACGRPQALFLQIFHEWKSVKIAHKGKIPLTPLRSKFRNFLCEISKFSRLKNPPARHDIFNKIRIFLRKESSQTMKKREHQNRFALCLSNNEFHILKQKFKTSNMKDKSAFLRHLIIYSYAYKIDYSEFQEYDTTTAKIREYLNQTALRINTTGNIYQPM